MSWYKKTLIKYTKEIISSAVFLVSLSLIILLWHFDKGDNFVWRNIEPISAPSLFARIFYSALVFVTVGFLLYLVRFYRLLHTFFVKFIGDRKLYKEVKKIIWGVLILIMYFYIVPKIVNVLNLCCSFIYNIYGFILFKLPLVGISSIILIASFFVIFKYKKTLKK